LYVTSAFNENQNKKTTTRDTLPKQKKQWESTFLLVKHHPTFVDYFILVNGFHTFDGGRNPKNTS